MPGECIFSYSHFFLTFFRYPKMGTNARVLEIGTPRTYKKFTKRPFGAVGGYRLDMKNSNQWSVPQNIGKKWGIWCVGDTTW